MNQSDGAEIDINCPECGRIRLSGWCNPCEFRWMNSTFSKSGNKYIDLLILQTQKNATCTCDYLEFIDFNNIEGFEYVAKGGFGSVYEGYWMEGPRWVWDEVSAAWCRNGPTKVALKKLDDSQEPSMNFLKQLETYHRCLQSGSMADCFGITRDETGCFMFVMRYYENGNIYDYLESNKGIISWRDMVDMLWGIAGGLERIHSEELGKWINAICDDPNPSEISNNFGLAEEKRWKTIKREIENNKLSKDLIHEDAIYTSRIFDFSIIQKLQN
ncbi:kinase-like protein [Gigaspora margarita]|uniref:Kinase-like protein n=1 Tax=Gigaspora margarita TaxID=4874 RepID=A0A8H4EJP1_GIGMA|nr:kinase-like protein [Gigaspora margarita]